MVINENVALFDMDQTLCDYNSSLYEGLERLRSPNEPIFLSKFAVLPNRCDDADARCAHKEIMTY